MKSPVKEAQETFFIKATRGADAQGEPTSDGFVVFQGSKIATSIVPSFTESFKRLRNQLIDNEVIGKQNGILVFLEDHVFSSPSTAAMIIMGRNANGLTEWKLKSGKTLKAFESEKSNQDE